MVYRVICSVATFLHGRDKNFLFGYWREFIKVVVCVVENEGVRTHGYGWAMLGLRPVGLARQMFTMEALATHHTHPTR